MRCSHTCKPRAITLIELVISMAIATVLGLLVVGLMRLISRASRETTSSYLISRDGEETIRILREDLRQTALSSVRVYSGETRQVPPSLTCASAQAPGQPIALNEDGQPRWTGSLSYRLETAANGQSASLIRTFTPYTPEQGFLPQVAPVPVPGPAAGQARVLLTNLAPPNAELPPTAAGEARRLGPSGGFQAVFLHRDPQTDQYVPSVIGPAETLGPSPMSQASNTRLIEVRLTLVLDLNTSTPSTLQIPVRVAPRF